MGKFGEKMLSFLGFEPAENEEDLGYEEEPDYLREDMIFEDDRYDEEEEDRRYTQDYAEEEEKEKERPRFGRKTQPEPQQQKVVNMPDTSKVRLLIYKPLSYEDTQNIIDNLKEKKSIVVNLDELDVDVAQRILDFISGAVYALNGNIRKAARNIFVVAPFNVDVTTSGAQAVSEEDNFKYFGQE